MVKRFCPKIYERYSLLLVGFTLFFLSGFVSSVYADSQIGKLIFKKRNCSLCHVVTRPGTEFKPVCPGLKGVKQQHSKSWVRQWLKNPAEVWKTNDVDVQSINKRYFEYRGSKPKPRESFMATVVGKSYVLSDEEIEHLIDYLWTL
ncbi:MAG: c-type cytochrome [Nitrospinales bacterium]